MEYITTDSKKLTSDEVHNLVDDDMPSDEEGTEEEDNCEPDDVEDDIIDCGRDSNDSFPPENNNSDDLSVPKVSEKVGEYKIPGFNVKEKISFSRRSQF